MRSMLTFTDRLVDRLVPKVPAAAETYKGITCSNNRCAIFWRQELEITCVYSSQGAICNVTGWIGCGC
ncbi:hypothetical protein [Rhizomonospora bruguierae]|uniref:hypothetical protein n=1 Tax=Rhizomonospora bruguierae TaxID=1581705 RepID=UPI001BCEC1EB|nr:hypothetical protein [Micromonospora sp. NBRC 107566]